MAEFPVWLQRPWDLIERMTARLPHAVLIHGPAGWGAHVLAERLAWRVLGLEPDRPLAELAHPDMRWLQPTDNVIKVDEIRRLGDFLVQTPQAGLRKVAVIIEAERMNANASNALLKSLEEPPAESFIIVTSHSAGRLLPTIRSRCQAVAIAPVGTEVTAPWLEGHGVDRDYIAFASAEYGDAPFTILSAFQREERPLWPALKAAHEQEAKLSDVADALKNEPLSELLERWIRVVHRLLRGGAMEQSSGIEFFDELLSVEKAALVNTGLNRQMQIERLLVHWRRVPIRYD